MWHPARRTLASRSTRSAPAPAVQDDAVPPPDLVVEVLSESTAANDRGTKFEDYASHGIGEYWIVDADGGTLEQYVLRGDQYELRLKGTDGTVRLAAIEGAEFPVRAFFDDSENDRAVAAARPST